MGNEWVVDWWLFGAVLAGLFFFGLSYNTLMSMLGDRKQGFTSFAVILGTIVTIIGAGYIVKFEPIPFWILFSCFVASGVPMTAGDIIRGQMMREKSIDRMKARADRSMEHMGGKE
jgi:hypothetical protein